MKRQLLLLASAMMAVAAVPAGAAQPAAQTTADSVQPHSSVSLAVDPALSDGRLVLRVAAKNSSASPTQFGPVNVLVSKPSGQAIGLYPLETLVNDVRLAAGMAVEQAPGGAPSAGAYAAPQTPYSADGRPDVSTYTGGAAVAGDEIVRRSQRRAAKPTISREEAARQITALKSGILQDAMVAPGQIAAGQVVSQKLDFGKDDDRTLHVRVRIAGDEHGFTIAAPRQ